MQYMGVFFYFESEGFYQYIYFGEKYILNQYQGIGVKLVEVVNMKLGYGLCR